MVSTSQDALPAAARLTKKLTPPSIPLPTTTADIIDSVTSIISSYVYTDGPEDLFAVSGRKQLKARVARSVERNEVIDIALPAFPAKSPSGAKVLGTLPDMAEEIVLRRLEGLCRSIEDIYEKGAILHIVSDGVVYAEILGISDRTVYKYNAALRSLVKEHDLKHISFARVSDLLRASSLSTNDVASFTTVEMTEDEYAAAAPIDRQAFLSRDIGVFDVEAQLREDVGVLRTYTGYKKFLELDLSDSDVLKDKNGQSISGKQRKKVIARIAKQMLSNGARFSHLVASAFPHAVRLSIHPHNNVGPKLALKVFPWTGSICTPWHNVVCEKKDGSTVIGNVSQFDDENHEIIYRYGRPYLIREKDEDLRWDGMEEVAFERLYPFGLRVVAPPGKETDFDQVPMDKIRKLCFIHSLILFSGFKSMDKDGFVKKSKEMGTVKPWYFGDIAVIKDDPSVEMNASLTREAMPIHYDGVFKVKKSENGTTESDPPLFQFFQCLKASKGDDGGLTLFTNTSDILKSLTKTERDFLRSKRWHIFIPSNDVFGGVPFDLPLVVKNDGTGHEVIRFHEEWVQELTNYKPVYVNFIDMQREQSRALCQRIASLLYDRQWCLSYSWEEGDIAVADNVELMHTRTAFKPCDRELWRVHIN